MPAPFAHHASARRWASARSTNVSPLKNRPRTKGTWRSTRGLSSTVNCSSRQRSGAVPYHPPVPSAEGRGVRAGRLRPYLGGAPGVLPQARRPACVLAARRLDRCRGPRRLRGGGGRAITVPPRGSARLGRSGRRAAPHEAPLTCKDNYAAYVTSITPPGPRQPYAISTYLGACTGVFTRVDGHNCLDRLR